MSDSITQMTAAEFEAASKRLLVFVQMVRPLFEVAEALGRIGSLMDAEQTARAQMSEARTQEQTAREQQRLAEASLLQERLNVSVAQEERQTILLKAQEDAERVRQQGRDEAEQMKAGANSEMERLRVLGVQANEALQCINQSIRQRTDELKKITDQVSAMRANISALTG